MYNILPRNPLDQKYASFVKKRAASIFKETDNFYHTSNLPNERKSFKIVSNSMKSLSFN